MTSWYQRAKQILFELDKTLPPDITIQEREKAIFDAYPWGERRYLPYKMWLKARKEYLGRWVKSDDEVKPVHLSPLERMMKKAKACEAAKIPQ